MSKQPKHLFAALLLIIYSAILIKIMVFKDIPTIKIGSLMLNFGGTDASRPANFIPFKTIIPYLFGYKGLIIAGINLVGNIVLLVPVGFILPFISPNITWKKSLALAVAAGLIIEGLQVVLHVGIFDIDDVILNAFGVMLGFWSQLILSKWLRTKNYLAIILTFIAISAVAATALYVVYPKGQPMMRAGTAENEASTQGDLCGGTGGTGEIVNLESDTFDLKRNDGLVQTVNLTASTTIRTSAGPIFANNLHLGDRVTVVINDDITASVVLVCGAANNK